MSGRSRSRSRSRSHSVPKALENRNSSPHPPGMTFEQRHANLKTRAGQVAEARIGVAVVPGSPKGRGTKRKRGGRRVTRRRRSRRYSRRR